VRNHEIEKRIENIIVLVDGFNKANYNLKRFKIFNAFTFSCDQIGDAKIAINVINEEGGAFENTMALLEESDENFIVSNLEDEKEYLWLAKTIDRFTKRTDELISKARELAKPQVGILVYDEFSDSYILNSTTGAILLKTKEVVKQIASTKIDLTNVLFNLRKGITQQEFGNEIIGETVEAIVGYCQKIVNDINAVSAKINEIERIPRVQIEFVVEDEKVRIKSCVTDVFNEMDFRGTTVNDRDFVFDRFSIDELEQAYNFLRTEQVLNNHMKELAKLLIAKTAPRLFVQNEGKKWVMTKEGRDVLDDLKIINFINEDVSSIEINIE
jgi:hypothetical protein